MAKSIASNTGGYGDIFAVNTPYIDNLSNRLYAEQKQRELEQQRSAQMLDQQMSKSLTSVRPADVSGVIGAYNDWKQSAISLIKGKNATPEQRLAVQAKKANLYGLINGSKEQKNYEESVLKGYQGNADKYDPDTHDILLKSTQTPYSELGDLKNYDYGYKGTNTDFGTIFKNAAGTPHQVYQQEAPVDEKGLQTKITPYSYGNTPQQYHDMVLASLAKQGAGRDAAALVSNFTPDVLKSVQDQYNAMPKEQWQQMGLSAPQNLDIQPDDSKAEIFAKHNAQLYALNNTPKEGMPQFKTNLALQRDQALSDAKDKANYQDGLIRGRMALSQNYKKAFKDYTTAQSEGEGQHVLQTFNDNTFNAGTNRLNGTNVDHITVDGKNYSGKIVDVPQTIKSAYTLYKGTDAAGQKQFQAPDAFYMTNDKKSIIPLYLGEKTASGGNYIKPDSKPVPIQNYNVELSKLLLTKAKTGGEVTDEDASGEYGLPQETPKVETQKQQKAVQLNGKVDPAQLRINQPYVVGGKTYIWDGKKLKAQ